ncbi:MAG: hypothetical protein WC674_04740 [Candidatus Krumholzibacteriia bacterium]
MMTRLTIAALLVLALAAGSLAQQTPRVLKPHEVRKPPYGGAIVQEPVYTDLPSSGKKCWIGDSIYFTYKFDKKPKLGTAILKVQLFDKIGAQIKSIDVVGISGMPSMGSAHDSGEVPFKLNKKGDYLLPVNVVMPGEWEVKLIFLKAKEPVFRGRIEFKV